MLPDMRRTALRPIGIAAHRQLGGGGGREPRLDRRTIGRQHRARIQPLALKMTSRC